MALYLHLPFPDNIKLYPFMLPLQISVYHFPAASIAHSQEKVKGQKKIDKPLVEVCRFLCFVDKKDADSNLIPGPGRVPHSAVNSERSGEFFSGRIHFGLRCHNQMGWRDQRERSPTKSNVAKHVAFCWLHAVKRLFCSEPSCRNRSEHPSGKWEFSVFQS